MAPTPNPRIVFESVPKDYPVPGETLVHKTDETIDLDDQPLNEGEILVKTLYLSLDPYMRGRLRSPEIKSYSPPYTLGEVPAGHGILRILRSNSSKFEAGQLIRTNVARWSAYSVLNDSLQIEPVSNPANLPVSVFLGIGGMPGQTAFYSTLEHAHWKKGETIFVSSAAGAVGSTVVQLAKAAGLKVIGSAGDDRKVEFLKSINTDVAFNYKTTDTDEVLKEHGPIDIYYDNVGAQTLDAALGNFNKYGRVIISGYASEYNKPKEQKPYGLINAVNILTKSLSVNGFLVFDLVAKYGTDAFNKEFAPLIANGTVKYWEHKTQGLEKLPEGLVELLKGGNIGKALVVVAEE